MKNVDFKNNDELVEAFIERFDELDDDIYNVEHEDFDDEDEKELKEQEDKIRDLMMDFWYEVKDEVSDKKTAEDIRDNFMFDFSCSAYFDLKDLFKNTFKEVF